MDYAQPAHAGPSPAAPATLTPEVSLVDTTADDRPTLQNLALFCTYDFSELIPRDVDEEDTFGGRGPWAVGVQADHLPLSLLCRLRSERAARCHPPAPHAAPGDAPILGAPTCGT